jgi:hypothetical protein
LARKLTEIIKSYPMLFGVFIGLLIFAYIIVTETWFPGISEAWSEHYRLVQSVCFTAGLFGTLTIQYWNRRHRVAFWALMCIFLLIHVLGVAYYATHIHPLVLSQWIILLVLECGVAALSMEWLIKKIGHLGRHSGSN